MHKQKNNFGFSLLEIIVSIALFSFVTLAIASMNKYLLNAHKKIRLAFNIEKVHSDFQYILSKHKECTASLKGHADGSDKVTVRLSEDEEYSLFKKFKDSGDLKKIEIQFQDFNNKRGYGILTFSYTSPFSTEITKKNVRVFLEVEEKHGVEVVKSCLSEDILESCPAGTTFLTSFNEASFNVLNSYTLDPNTPLKNRMSGVELIHKGSSLFDDGTGEYCISYNICMKGDWHSNSLCYDSCRNKFWTDGMLSYEDKEKVDIKNNEQQQDPFICPEETFSFPPSCVGKSLRSVHLKKATYGKRISHTQDIKDNHNKKVGDFQAGFECTYAGTWALKFAKCRNLSYDTNGFPLYNKEWDHMDPHTNLSCSTFSKDILIHSHDKKLSKNVELGKIYQNRMLNIGDPRRLIIGFKDKLTSATVVCKKNGASLKWEQVGESIKNCNALSNPQPQVDVLFVVDNSGSMGDEQEQLSASIDQFVNAFFSGKANSINYYITVITTDSKISGSYRKKEFTANPTGTISSLKNSLKPGTEGSPWENPMTSTINFLNSGSSFYRPSAHLAILFVTDETNPRENYHDFINYLQTIKGNDKTKIITHGALGNETDYYEEGWYSVQTEIYKTNPHHIPLMYKDLFLKPVIEYYGGNIFDIDDKDGYGKGLAKFAEKIVEQVLVFGN